MLEYATKDNLVEIIDKHLVEGEALAADVVAEGTRFQFMPIADMVVQIDSTRYIVHGFVPRPGVADFTMQLEHGHYPIASPKNDLMQLWNFRFCGGVWVAITIPPADESIAVAVAKANRLHLDDHLPLLVLNGRDVDWPIRRGKHLVMTPGTTLYGFRDPAL